MRGLPTGEIEGRPQGGYVFAQWTRDDYDGGIRENYAVLTEGYGMMIFSEGSPSAQGYYNARFRLFAHDCGVIIDTTDMAELKRAIARIPAGETIRLIDTCGGSTFFGTDPAIVSEIEDFCRHQGIEFADHEEGVLCQCA